MKLEAVVNLYRHSSIEKDMESASIPSPVLETFEQDTPYDTDFDYIADRYISFTWITATPDDLEASIDPFDLEGFVPRHDVVYRLKLDVARENGLKCTWTFGRDAKDVTAPDGRVVEFPKGSNVLQCEYDPGTVVPIYERLEGSL
jgi:hypothetical protein